MGTASSSRFDCSSESVKIFGYKNERNIKTAYWYALTLRNFGKKVRGQDYGNFTLALINHIEWIYTRGQYRRVALIVITLSGGFEEQFSPIQELFGKTNVSTQSIVSITLLSLNNANALYLKVCRGEFFSGVHFETLYFKLPNIHHQFHG